jgi:hypothetical protein
MGCNEIWESEDPRSCRVGNQGTDLGKHDHILLTYRMQVLSQARLKRSMFTDKEVSLLSCDVGSETSDTVAPH